jgi:hypothetical protein
MGRSRIEASRPCQDSGSAGYRSATGKVAPKGWLDQPGLANRSEEWVRWCLTDPSSARASRTSKKPTLNPSRWRTGLTVIATQCRARRRIALK